MNYVVRIKRVYSACESADGVRVLVDRLWPRGQPKQDLSLREWLKDAAPSPALRRSWHQGAIDAAEFADRYCQEIEAEPENLTPLMRYARQGPLTLLTATRNPELSHLPILRDMLRSALEEEDRQADGREPSSPVCYADDGAIEKP